ncbi:MAG TPA: hypothetical protein VKR79_04670 [Gaiellaceae bacterium]|nr:hypothetical protein [Gaiellaceae bacterium]
MDSTVPTTGAEHLPAAAADAAVEERLDRNLTPAIAELGESRGFLRYAIGALTAGLVLLAVVFMFNAIVDPLSLIGWRILPPAVETDRSIKLDLIQKLKTNPQVVVLGSSRSRQAEPAFIDKLTGLKSGFNAGVTGGTAADAWVMIRNIGARFPNQKRTYIWFLDWQLATNGINPQLAQDPRSRPYLGNKSVQFSLADVGTYIGFQATKASYRVLKACAEGHCHGNVLYNADGSIKGSALKYLPERAKSLKLAVAQRIQAVKHESRTLPPFTAKQFLFFDEALAWMNAHGATPVIVLNPIYPSVYRLLQKRHSQRESEALAELHKLQHRFHFVVVDCSDIRTWGGKAKDFNNATHVNRTNMRRMLRYIVKHSDGALR